MWSLQAVTAVALNACAAASGPAPVPITADAQPRGNPLLIETPTPQPPLATPESTAFTPRYGPDQDQFPNDVNPLTGQRVADPALLKIPAVLVSISHFPAAGRPQAGLSFSPFVYEFSITGGETRFLTTFYGQFPSPEVPVTGDCQVRTGIFEQTGILLGNRVWLDENRNGVQDPGEEGIPGICVGLHDSGGVLIGLTTTDTNGMYGFNVEAGRVYSLQFLRPTYLDFAKSNVGDGATDSDADDSTGRTPYFRIEGDTRLWDAGLFPNETYRPSTSPVSSTPKAEVGPVRSGRLLYAYIGRSYQNSCLIYAFASPEVLAKLPHCSFVAHEVAGGGEMLGIERMKAVAEDNMRHSAARPFVYASNMYVEDPPAGGVPARRIDVFFGNLNQSGWRYDPLYKAYLRYVDTADVKARGILHADDERLTGRQLHFENVVVIMADTDVITRSNIDIHLDEGNTGAARLFRDGQLFPITWSTRAGAYEKHTGFRRPVEFLNLDGSPAALKPGHTWVIIVTPFSSVTPQGGGEYSVRYEAPAGEAR